MSSLPSLINIVMQYPKFGKGLCLDRITDLLTKLELDQYVKSTPRVAIAGSNGKGSTVAILAKISQLSFKKVGAFTSPHFLHFNERFSINSVPCDDNILLLIAKNLDQQLKQRHADLHAQIGVFEFQFLLALTLFKQEKCDFLVIEAGIGAQYDPVRTLQAPIAAITSLDLEHTELLGDSLVSIAKDKSYAAADKGMLVVNGVDRNICEDLSPLLQSRHVALVPAKQVCLYNSETQTLTHLASEKSIRLQAQMDTSSGECRNSTDAF